MLVVDDEVSVRRLLKNTLERSGYRVLEAQHGREALDAYGEHGASIAVVILDMTMPVLGGVPTMMELVKMNPEVRIIASSGIHDNEAAARAVGPQVKRFLGKPFTGEQLLRMVRSVVTGRSSVGGPPPYTARQ